jgi:protein farnesyltransferase/geranylgeranyltransferase type-1 subunit alpha
VWEQKRFLLDYHQQPEREMEVSRMVIEEIDSKNYHAWSFRTWLVERTACWEEELAFAEEMIAEDCFNNSAWSYRFFLLGKLAEGQEAGSRREVAAREIEYTLGHI